jgi:ABC-type multidrug transport system fused ATPase/permease subunit
VQDALEELLEGRTAIVIAHRLSTIRRADKVLVVEQGRIVEQGNAAQLLALGGTFSRYWEAQQLA